MQPNFGGDMVQQSLLTPTGEPDPNAMNLEALRAEFKKRVAPYCPDTMTKDSLIEALKNPEVFIASQKADDHIGDPYFKR